MMFKIIYETVKAAKKKQETNYIGNVDVAMKAHINKYLQELKLIEIKDINTTSPSQQDIILYLIYLLMDQKQNDKECIESIKETLYDKLNYGMLTRADISNVIDTFKTRMELN